MRRIGIFGGSFDPIHSAHLMIAESVRDERSLDEVLFIPAKSPPHKPKRRLTPAAHRLEMVRLAIADNPGFKAYDLELNRQGPSYTITTIRELKRAFSAETRFFLILGGDSLHDLPSWHMAEEIVSAVDVIAVQRPGFSVEGLSELETAFGTEAVRRIKALAVEFPPVDISATLIRGLAESGRSLRYLVPDPVRRYINEHGLFKKS